MLAPLATLWPEKSHGDEDAEEEGATRGGPEKSGGGKDAEKEGAEKEGATQRRCSEKEGSQSDSWQVCHQKARIREKIRDARGGNVFR